MNFCAAEQLTAFHGETLDGILELCRKKEAPRRFIVMSGANSALDMVNLKHDGDGGVMILP
jgi:hypothetical protein